MKLYNFLYTDSLRHEDTWSGKNQIDQKKIGLFINLV